MQSDRDGPSGFGWRWPHSRQPPPGQLSLERPDGLAGRRGSSMNS